LNEIEKVQRAFIWGDTEDKRKAHLISWDTMTQPKSCGGLGFRKLHKMNEACLMKMGWSLMSGEYSLWGEVLLGKYRRGDWSQRKIIVNSNDSPLWKALANCWPKLEFHRCWSIGDGSQAEFWNDKWFDEKFRISDVDFHIPNEVRGWKVKDAVLANGEWNFELLRNLVPNSIIQKLHAIIPPCVNQEADALFWPGTTSGKFTVTAAYQLLNGVDLLNVDKKWQQIWKINCIERTRVFVWQLMHDRLLTKARLARWQIGDPLCHSCNQFEETIIHVVRDCASAVDVWKNLLSTQERGKFFVVEAQEWINLNIANKFGQRYGNDWQAIWATTCYLLWQWRNKSMHDDEFVRPERTWKVIEDYVHTYRMSMAAEEQVRHGASQQWMNIRWVSPPSGWFVLNTDGAAKASDKRAGCGGILRRDNGMWVEGFAKALGDTTAYMAELWGIYEGLLLANRRAVERLELRTDSQIIAQSLQERTNGSMMGCALLRRIRSLLDGPWEVKIIHVYREANRCADMLANMGSEGTSGIEFFDSPPAKVLLCVDDDIRGVSYPRLISV
jgi:ribonuclease HI